MLSSAYLLHALVLCDLLSQLGDVQLPVRDLHLASSTHGDVWTTCGYQDSPSIIPPDMMVQQPLYSLLITTRAVSFAPPVSG